LYDAVGRSGLAKLDSLLATKDDQMSTDLSAANEITIARPVDQVFAFFANPENDPRWRPGLLKITHVSGQGEGARYAQQMKGPGGASIKTETEVVTLDPLRRIEFTTVKGFVQPRGRFLFSEAAGGTSVRFELEAQLGALKGLLMGSMVKKTMESEVGNLTRAKDVLERGD
jgi:uncharacterized membrane protein